MFYNEVLDKFYAGKLTSIEELEDEIRAVSEVILNMELANVYDGDQGYQESLMELGALNKAHEKYDQYYDEKGNYIFKE